MQQGPYQTNQEALRNQAIDLYLQGMGPAAIARHLGRSRKWFYETLHRFQKEGRAGLASRSRRPHHSPMQIAPEVEAAVLRVRRLLDSGEDPVLRFGNRGADAIAAELKRAGMEPPSRATINRILQRHGLSKPPSPQQKKQTVPNDYPWPQVRHPHVLHAMDFMERVLPGGPRIYACNLLDVFCQWPFLAILTRKTKQAVMDFFLAAWQDIGRPNALMVDNDPVWRGSSSAPYTFSTLVRLWLYLGIQVIFIPPYTPQANTWIESFNRLWARNFWERLHFQDVSMVQQTLPDFQTYCREHRPLPGGLTTPAACRESSSPALHLPEHIQLPSALPLCDGVIHFLRFVNSRGTFSLLNATWTLDSQWAGKTIRATLVTGEHRLYVYHQNTPAEVPVCIADFPFPVREEVFPVPEPYCQTRIDLWAGAS